MIHQFPALAAQPASGKTFLVLDLVVEDTEPSYSLPQLYIESVRAGFCVCCKATAVINKDNRAFCRGKINRLLQVTDLSEHTHMHAG